MNENKIINPKFSFQYLFSSIYSYGVIGALLIIIYRVILFIFNTDTFSPTASISNFVYNLVILSACCYIGTKYFRDKKMAGILNYGKSLLSCFIIGFIISAMVYFYDLFFNFVIAPDFMRNSIDNYMGYIDDNVQIPAFQKGEIIKQLSAMSDNPFRYLTNNLLNATIISGIFSLIIAVFVKKNNIEYTNSEVLM
jgi:small basic protein